uniref:Uncharacterized protein n=1 Tax=Romanomermis culicivorax TaxID=13658 RepID=A0A915I4A0_ROMCU
MKLLFAVISILCIACYEEKCKSCENLTKLCQENTKNLQKKKSYFSLEKSEKSQFSTKILAFHRRPQVPAQLNIVDHSE